MSYDRADTTEMAWSEHSRCAGVDPDLFFPDRGQDPAPAKAICRQCEVRTACLNWALDTGQKHGIWGGMTEGQRRRLRRPADDFAGAEPAGAEPAGAGVEVGADVEAGGAGAGVGVLVRSVRSSASKHSGRHLHLVR